LEDGTVLSSIEADQIADRITAEAGLPPGLVPGGKSLSGGRNHSPRFQVVLGEDTAAKVRAAAHDRGMSVSRYLRGVVEQELAAR
jgi:hypothetical protein